MTHKDQIIELHKEGFRNYQICYWLNQNRSVVAGVIWRYKNPGMHKKGVKSTEYSHRPPYSKKNA